MVNLVQNIEIESFGLGPQPIRQSRLNAACEAETQGTANRCEHKVITEGDDKVFISPSQGVDIMRTQFRQRKMNLKQ